MADNENAGVDIVISGPDGGDNENLTEPVTRLCNVYRVDFEDGATKEYAATNDIEAIFLARRDKPAIARVQISRVSKNVTLIDRGKAGEG